MAFVSFNKFKILNMLNKTVVGGISSFLTSEFLFSIFPNHLITCHVMIYNHVNWHKSHDKSIWVEVRFVCVNVLIIE